LASTQRIERGGFFSMKETPTRKIDLDLENSIFSHDLRLCGESFFTENPD
jgi:hypothetical protein